MTKTKASKDEIPTLDELMATRSPNYQSCTTCGLQDENAGLRADIKKMADGLKAGTCRAPRSALYEWLRAKYGDGMAVGLSSFRAHLKNCMGAPGSSKRRR